MAGTSTEQPATAAAAAEAEADVSDHLRHIICVVCHPAFDGALEAPHDAACICGRPVRKGDRRNPTDTAQCILCNELWNHHAATHSRH